MNVKHIFVNISADETTTSEYICGIEDKQAV
jgi:hypothetical protein